MSDPGDFGEQIQEEIADAILQDPRILVEGLEVSGDGDMIGLSGAVKSYEERQVAEEHAWAYPGVNTVRNNIRVEGEDEGPLDSEAEEEIRNRLAVSVDIDAEGLELTYDAGVVLLHGTVDSAWKRERLLDLLQDIPTVTDFELQVAVVPRKDPSDMMLANDLLEAFGDLRRVDLNTLTVTVDKGVVTLSGRVPSWETRTTAFEAALLTPGVEEVIDEMDIQARF